MPSAYVLINSDMGYESEVLKEIKKVEGVEQVFALYGVYDIIVRVSSESLDELKNIITWKIRRMKGVTAALPMILQKSNEPLFNDEVTFSCALPVVVQV
jgi:DNA-binding Lrp family transcriptional regulator